MGAVRRSGSRLGLRRCRTLFRQQGHELEGKKMAKQTKLQSGALLVLSLISTGARAQKMTRQGLLHSQTEGPPLGADSIVLKADTPVLLRLSETLNSKKGEDIEGVRFQVIRDVKVGDSVLIARGAEAWGTSETKMKTSYGRSGKLVVRMDEVYAITGAQVFLRGDSSAQGAFTGFCQDPFSCSIFLALGPWIKGKDASVPKGTKVNAFVSEDTLFDKTEVKKAFDEATLAEATKRAVRADEATIHVYRLANSWGKTEVFLDDVSVAHMGSRWETFENGVKVMSGRYYIALKVTPGKHILAAGKTRIVFHPEGGEEYYVRVSDKPKLELVPGDQGEDESFPFTPDR